MKKILILSFTIFLLLCSCSKKEDLPKNEYNEVIGKDVSTESLSATLKSDTYITNILVSFENNKADSLGATATFNDRTSANNFYQQLLNDSTNYVNVTIENKDVCYMLSDESFSSYKNKDIDEIISILETQGYSDFLY